MLVCLQMFSFIFSGLGDGCCEPLQVFLTRVCLFLRYHWQHHGGPEAGGSCDRRRHQRWTCIEESRRWIRNGERTVVFSISLAVFLDQLQHLQVSSSPLQYVGFPVTFTLRQCGHGVPPSGFLSSHNLPAVLGYTSQNFVFKVVFF